MVARTIGVLIDQGEIPSARGVAEGYELALVIGRWQGVAHGSFRDDCRFLKQMIEETDELRLWEKSVGGFRYPDRDTFLREQVLIDYELTEQDMAEIVAMLRQDNIDGVQARFKTHGGKRVKGQVAISHLSETSSDSRRRILTRLARDHPEIFADYERGEYPSARAAAKSAGIVKDPTPLSLLRKAWAKASPDERAAFLAEVAP